MHYNPDPLQLEFELSSMCNSLCLGCVRTDNKNFNHTKSMIPHKQMLDLKTFKKIVSSPNTKNNIKYAYKIYNNVHFLKIFYYAQNFSSSL